MRFTLAILTGKLILTLSRLFPFIGGTALPGLIALKIDPKFLISISSKNQLKSIIISGTNGKTTTSRLLAYILKQNSLSFIQNRTGSNLLRGIASTLLSHTNSRGVLKIKLAVWEIDEAVIPQAVQQLKPAILLFTNLFRDQLDRYGEIDTILKNWLVSLKSLPHDSKLIVNIDDPSLNYLSSFWSKKGLITFGLTSKSTNNKSLSHAADATFCPVCLKPLKFTHIFTSHLGHYACTSCQFKRNIPSIPSSKKLKSPLPGLYNRYNSLAAGALAKALNIKSQVIVKAFKSFKPAFGRTENFKLFNKSAYIFLVKNPAGFNAVLETLKQKNHLSSPPLLLALNDQIADGTDVSWIWDVDFEILKNRKAPLIISGLRAHDLSLRLKYAGLNPKLIITKPQLKSALAALKNQKSSPIYLLPTYTAMLNLREILRKKNILHSTWKD